MWSIWPDPEQIKVNGEAAAGPAPAPAGRELHKRMWLGMVLGRSRAKHVRGCAGHGTASVGGGKEALLKIHRDLGQALFFGDNHSCSSSLCFLSLQTLVPPGHPARRSQRPGHEDSIPLSAGR